MAPKNPKPQASGTKRRSYNCLACNNKDNEWMVCCDNCDGWYHYLCVGVTDAVANEDWRCKSCSDLLTIAITGSQHTLGASDTHTVNRGDSNMEINGGERSTDRRRSLTGEEINGRSAANGCSLQSPSLRSLPKVGDSLAVFSAPASTTIRSITLAGKQTARGAAKSTCSKTSKGSNISIRRLQAEMQLVQEEKSILQQKETLVRQRETLLRRQRDLVVQLEEEEEKCSESEDEEESSTHVETWLKETCGANSLPTGAPGAESTTAAQTNIQPRVRDDGRPSSAPTVQQQDPLLRQVLEKLIALEMRCVENTRNNSSEWLPGVVPSNMTSAAPVNNAITVPQTDQNYTRRINADQLAARNGLSKDLPKFMGKPEEWPLFIASYEQTTDICGFSDHENLIRLRQALDGSARSAVKNLLLHASCVPQIISTLRMKFGRPELIIDTLLSQIREMPPPKENRPETLVDFAIEVQNICATMKASGLLNHLNNPELEQELVSKLPGLLGPFWGMHKLTLSTTTLEDFSNWLFQLAQGANSIIIPSTSSKVRRRGMLNTHTELSEDVNTKVCVICKGNCLNVETCNVFSKLSRPEKWKAVRTNQLCRRCLNPHYPRACLFSDTCGVDGCRFFHHPSLHKRTTPATTSISTHMSCNAHRQDHDPILFRVLPVTLYGTGVQLSTFAFFDEGSSLTLIDEDLMAALHLKGTTQPLHLQWTSNTHRYEDDSKLVNLEISGVDRAVRFPLKDVHTVKNLSLPQQTLDAEKLKDRYKYLIGLPLKSYTNAVPKLLIGLNNCRLGVSLKSKEGASFEPVAEKTRLGWTIKGQLTECESRYFGKTNHFCGLHICDCDTSVTVKLLETVKNYICLDNLGTEGKSGAALSKDDQCAYEQLQKFTRRVGDHFETSLLWNGCNTSLPDSRPMAKRRARCMLMKMQKDPSLAHALQRKMDDYLAKGYARKLRPDEINETNCWYLPVFPVSNPNKPGKLRLVWDAAAKVDGVSLNTMLLKGPDQLTSLVSALRKFRQRRVAIGGDIAEMYHQVKVRKVDQNYQRFLWIEPGSQTPTAYVMMVMTFGAACSPSSAEFVKNRNAEDFREQYPRAVQCILENHYVDDMLDSVDTEEEAIRLAREVHLVHSKGGFQMRNWVSNSKTVLNALNVQTTEALDLNGNHELTTEKVLGMWWSTEDDCFTFKMSKRYRNDDILLGNRRPTKREVLSLVMTIFDPLGLLGFYVMYAKIILQETWRSGCTWDQPIHDEQYSKWKTWLRLLPEVAAMKIPRCYLNSEFCLLPSMELHTFVDASENGYAAVSYLRCSDGYVVDCVLLGSKTRVAPLKMMSVPRLELQAAVLGARLARTLIATHSIKISKVIFWSDSLTVLSWLRSDHRRYSQFVAFRVSEILELTDLSNWRWLPTAENVADEATKWQKIPDFSNNSRWLNGPAFLKEDPSAWPQENGKGCAPTDQELRAQYVGVHVTEEVFDKSNPLIQPERFSTWKRLLKITAAVIHIARFCREKVHGNPVKINSPSQDEILLAETILYKEVQANSYSEEITLLSKGNSIKKASPLYKLSAYLDTDGVLRLGGRVTLENKRDPIILPRSEYVTTLIVLDRHCRYHHVNHETVVNEIRQEFWISRLRATLSKVRRNCQDCKNHHARPLPPKMALLPPARVAAFCRPFTYVGVDYFGPMFVSVRRSSEKRYGVLLTCLTTRAIHLEVAQSLSTDSCIIAIRNFMARRGSPVELWSDNGTNFKGAERQLKEAFATMNQNEMIKAFTSSSMTWRFIPPASPHMGGVWERLVRSVKDVLHKVLPSRNPTEELLRGALMEVEMIVNSRPLTYIPISHEEEEALTPNHFLLGSSTGIKPLAEPVSDGIQLRRNWQTSQQLANAFWKRWVREYLPVITRRCKWFDEVKHIEVDDIVYIVDPDSPRNCWPKGRVVEVKKSPDGRVRSAVVKTAAGLYTRPATKLAVLDIRRLNDVVSPRKDVPGGSVATDLATSAVKALNAP